MPLQPGVGVQSSYMRASNCRSPVECRSLAQHHKSRDWVRGAERCRVGDDGWRQRPREDQGGSGQGPQGRRWGEREGAEQEEEGEEGGRLGNSSTTSWEGGWVVDKRGEASEEKGAGVDGRERVKTKSESSDLSSTASHLPGLINPLVTTTDHMFTNGNGTWALANADRIGPNVISANSRFIGYDRGHSPWSPYPCLLCPCQPCPCLTRPCFNSKPQKKTWSIFASKHLVLHHFRQSVLTREIDSRLDFSLSSDHRLSIFCCMSTGSGVTSWKH